MRLLDPDGVICAWERRAKTHSSLNLDFIIDPIPLIQSPRSRYCSPLYYPLLNLPFNVARNGIRELSTLELEVSI